MLPQATARPTRTDPVAPVSSVSPERSVVVAVDGAWAGRRALEQAALDAERRHTAVLVVTVVQSAWSDHDAGRDWRDAERDALESARAVNEAARLDLHRIRPALAVHRVVAGSVDELGGIDADLLVLGRSGASGHGVFRMGTTSADLASTLRCPVLVCRDERGAAAQPPRSSLRQPEVVGAVHLDVEVPTVLGRAVDEANRRGTPLCVFTRDDGAAVDVRVVLDADARVPWRIVHTTDGEAAEAILRYADPDDLVVLGNRGRDRLAGHVRGSVTRAVLDAMPCDVLLVPM